MACRRLQRNRAAVGVADQMDGPQAVEQRREQRDLVVEGQRPLVRPDCSAAVAIQVHGNAVHASGELLHQWLPLAA